MAAGGRPPAKNRYWAVDGVVHMELTRGQTCRLDAADLPLVAGYRWYAKYSSTTKAFYAASHRRSKGPVMHMNSLLMGTIGTGLHSDHINHDTLDNRRRNLRVCSNAQNQQHARLSVRNRSGFRGVRHRRDVRKWEANIVLGGRQRYLGLFPSAEDAARAYDDAARAEFGEFAMLNFPQGAAA